MPSQLVTASHPRGAHASDSSPAPPARGPRARRTLALIAGVLTLGGGALALPTTASAIVIIGGTPAGCTSSSVFSGIGTTRSLEVLSINALQPCVAPGAFPGPAFAVALWRPPGALTAIDLQPGCLSIDIGRTQSTLHASARSATAGGYFIIHAVDGGLGGPDTFGVRRSTAPPTGFTDPNLKCGAREVATSAVVAGNFVAFDAGV